MSTKNKSKPIEIHYNDTLPLVFVDAIRTGHRKDGLTYMSLATQLPEYLIEQVRLVIPDESLYLIIDELCKTTNYFPQKPSQKTRRPSK